MKVGVHSSLLLSQGDAAWAGRRHSDTVVCGPDQPVIRPCPLGAKKRHQAAMLATGHGVLRMLQHVENGGKAGKWQMGMPDD